MVAIADLTSTLKSTLTMADYKKGDLVTASEGHTATVTGVLENQAVITGMLKGFGRAPPPSAEVVAEAFAKLDSENSYIFSGATSATGGKLWAKKQGNRLRRYWYYLIKLKRNSPQSSDNVTIQAMKNMLADPSPSSPAALPAEQPVGAEVTMAEPAAIADQSPPASSSNEPPLTPPSHLHSTPGKELSSVSTDAPDALLVQLKQRLEATLPVPHSNSAIFMAISAARMSIARAERMEKELEGLKMTANANVENVKAMVAKHKQKIQAASASSGSCLHANGTMTGVGQTKTAVETTTTTTTTMPTPVAAALTEDSARVLGFEGDRQLGEEDADLDEEEVDDLMQVLNEGVGDDGDDGDDGDEVDGDDADSNETLTLQARELPDQMGDTQIVLDEEMAVGTDGYGEPTGTIGDADQDEDGIQQQQQQPQLHQQPQEQAETQDQGGKDQEKQQKEQETPKEDQTEVAPAGIPEGILKSLKSASLLPPANPTRQPGQGAKAGATSGGSSTDLPMKRSKMGQRAVESEPGTSSTEPPSKRAKKGPAASAPATSKTIFTLDDIPTVLKPPENMDVSMRKSYTTKWDIYTVSVNFGKQAYWVTGGDVKDRKLNSVAWKSLGNPTKAWDHFKAKVGKSEV